MAITKDDEECQPLSHSPNSMDAINPVGAKVSSSDGNNNEECGVISVGLKSDYNPRNRRYVKNTGMATMRTTVTKGPISRDDIGISDCENGSDKNEKKMEGIRGFVFTIAASSLGWSVALIPYWIFSCSNTPLSNPLSIPLSSHLSIPPSSPLSITLSSPLSSSQMDDLLAVGIVLVTSTAMLTGLAAYFKEGKLPDSRGFKVLQIVQLLLLLCLWAASITPLHVCRRSSNWVVWTLASAAFCIIVLPWIAVFEHTEVVIKRMKSVIKKVLQWIKAKFKKVLKMRTDPILPQ